MVRETCKIDTWFMSNHLAPSCSCCWWW